MSYRDGLTDTSRDGQRSSLSSTSSGSQGHDPHNKTPYVFALGGSDSVCKECGKHVYEMEKTVADLIVYHKSCFRCTQCKKLLNASTFTSMGGVLYCKPHFIELSKPKGPCVNDEDEERSDLDDEENRENILLPAVKNMKGLFETHGQASASFSPQSTGYSPNYKKSASKWEKSSEHASAKPINLVDDYDDDDNDDDDDDDDEDVPADEPESLPPVDITRNLVAKFRSLEQGDGSTAPVVPKPVRQFTPPRESPERARPGVDRDSARVADDVVRADDPAELEDELPPPCITRNLAAMFGAKISSSSATDRSVVAPGKRNSIRMLEELERTNGGVFENEPEENDDIIRETDRGDETDLPEAGMARALVAQWKTREVEKSVPLPSTSSQHAASFGPTQTKDVGKTGVLKVNHDLRTTVEYRTETTEQQETEEAAEDELPPQDITRNLLAKFQTIQIDHHSTVNQMPTRKQFRWDVKEAKPINYPGLVTVSKAPYNGDERPYEEEISDNDEDLPEREDVESPQPAYTKIMLEKFRGMETS